jgi:hypothetical protein
VECWGPASRALSHEKSVEASDIYRGAVLMVLMNSEIAPSLSEGTDAPVGQNTRPIFYLFGYKDQTPGPKLLHAIAGRGTGPIEAHIHPHDTNQSIVSYTATQRPRSGVAPAPPPQRYCCSWRSLRSSCGSPPCEFLVARSPK